MAHIHACADCDADFSCDELEIESEHREGCSVEPPRCQSCEQHANEAAYERSLSDFYGGSGCVTINERMTEASALDRSQK